MKIQIATIIGILFSLSGIGQIKTLYKDGPTYISKHEMEWGNNNSLKCECNDGLNPPTTLEVYQYNFRYFLTSNSDQLISQNSSNNQVAYQVKADKEVIITATPKRSREENENYNCPFPTKCKEYQYKFKALDEKEFNTFQIQVVDFALKQNSLTVYKGETPRLNDNLTWFDEKVLYKGPALTGDLNDPTVAPNMLPGTYEITVERIFENGLKRMKLILIIKEFKWINTDEIKNLCTASPVVELSNYVTTTENVIFFGNGVNGTLFDPNVAGIGTHPINAVKGSLEITFPITVSNSPNIIRDTSDYTRSFCVDEGEFQIKDRYCIDKYKDWETVTTVCKNYPVTNLGLLEQGKYIEFKNRASEKKITSWFDPSVEGIRELPYVVIIEYKPPCSNAIVAEHLRFYVKPSFDLKVGDYIRVCQNGDPVSLNPGTDPTGGTWNGPYTKDNLFHPLGAIPGEYFPLYTVSKDGCTKSKTKKVVVEPLPIVSAGENDTVCFRDEEIVLQGTPVGGIWSGVGAEAQDALIQGNVVLVRLLPPGKSYQFKFTYTNPATGCVNTATKNIVVNPTPNKPESVGNIKLCGPGKITLFEKNPPPNEEGIWYKGLPNKELLGYGQSITTEVNTTSQFWLFKRNAFGCVSSRKEIDVEIIEPPIVEAGDTLRICKNANSQRLIGIPDGGTWNGPGVIKLGDDYHFYGQDVPVGEVTLVYTVSKDGCTGSDTKIVEVIPQPNVEAGEDLYYCVENDSLNLLTSGVFPEYGVWELEIDSLNKYIQGHMVDADKLGVGTFNLIYRDTTGCTNTDERKLIINLPPKQPEGISGYICDSGRVQLGSDIKDPDIGFWYDVPTGSIELTQGDSFLTPPITQSTNYYLSIKDTNNCHSERVAVLAEVKELPTIDLHFDGSIVCETQKQIELGTKVNPTGGTFEGKATDGNVFYPPIAGLGDWPIIYRYSDTYGCENSKVGSIKVVSDLSEDIIGPDTSICNSSLPLNLFKICKVKEGKFEGEGVVDSLFYPSQVSPGKTTIKYTWERECTVRDEKIITIIESPSKPEVIGKNQGCEEEIIRFASNQPADKFEWFNNAGQLIGTESTIEITLGDYNKQSLRLRTTNQFGCQSMDFGKVEIKTFTPHGKISSSTDSTVISSEIPTQFSFVGVDEANHKYIWTWEVGGKTSYSFEKDPYHYFLKPGWVKTTLGLVSKEGCENFLVEDSLLFVKEPIGIAKLTKDHGLKIGPNPTTGELYISFNNEFEGLISISDITGKELMSKSVNSKNCNFNISNLRNGVYFILFQTNNIRHITRISKTR